MKLLVTISLLCSFLCAEPRVQLGVDLFFQDAYFHTLKGKNVALITNHTGMNRELRSTLELLREAALDFNLVALFTPEHGLTGVSHAGETVGDKKAGKLHCYSLHGPHRRPT